MMPRVTDDESPTEAQLRAASAPRRLLLVMSATGVYTHALPARGTVVIGRGVDCDVRIEDAKSSRRHASLHVGDVCEVEDHASTNGTRIGDTKLAPSTRVVVRPGEYFAIGSTVLLVQSAAELAPPARVWSKQAFAEHVERARASAGTFGLLRVDLGEWSSANAIRTTYRGRTSSGDAAWVEGIERVFSEALRPVDVIGSTAPGRYDVLLPATSPDEASGIAAHLLHMLHDASFPCTMRVACFPRDGDTIDSLERHMGDVRDDEEAPASVASDGGFQQRISPMVHRVAAGEINVLVLGETGVGKEVLARALHVRSSRASKPLVSINCAALSESLLESELFGHERGAFTGAVQAKPGLLESADGGVVFLDEIGEMPLTLQAKLLRVIEQREVLRVGSLRPRPIDVRFFAATNRDLQTEASAGRFRQDLYFRLNGISIEIPPLRERKDEIAPLARAFVVRACERARRPRVLRIAAPVIEVLERYHWPGNIRELRNVMERAVLLTSGDEISLESFPANMLTGPLRAFGPPVDASGPSRNTLPPTESREPKPPAIVLPEGDERARIIAALAACDGNQTHAAKLLGISRRTLVTRIEEYDLPRPRKKPPA
jgi:DNA-binding NtrC family response regulator